MMINVVVDSCVFISSIEEREIRNRDSKAFFDSIPTGTKIILPILVPLETAVTAAKAGKSNARELLEYFHQFELIAIDSVSLPNYFALLSGDLGLRTADFILAVTAKLNDAILVTWDKRLLDNKICQAMTPSDFLKAKI